MRVVQVERQMQVRVQVGNIVESPLSLIDSNGIEDRLESDRLQNMVEHPGAAMNDSVSEYVVGDLLMETVNPEKKGSNERLLV